MCIGMACNITNETIHGWCLIICVWSLQQRCVISCLLQQHIEELDALTSKKGLHWFWRLSRACCIFGWALQRIWADQSGLCESRQPSTWNDKHSTILMIIYCLWTALTSPLPCLSNLNRLLLGVHSVEYTWQLLLAVDVLKLTSSLVTSTKSRIRSHLKDPGLVSQTGAMATRHIAGVIPSKQTLAYELLQGVWAGEIGPLVNGYEIEIFTVT